MAGNFWRSSHYQQWILDKQDLVRQRADDLKYVNEEEYQRVMIFFINYIHAIAQEPPLSTKQQMIATACVYFRRFYARRSLKDIDPFLLAPTCLLLAAKVDEYGLTSHMRLSHAISSLMKKLSFLPQDALNLGLMQEAEFYLLEVMDCCLVVYHPYRTILQIVRDMKVNINQKDRNLLLHDSWRIANDSLRTDACLLYAPHQIALACLLTATILNKKEAELRDFFQEINIDLDQLYEITRMILSGIKLYVSMDLRQVARYDEFRALLAKIPKPTAGLQPSHVPQQISLSRMQHHGSARHHR